MRKNEIRDFPLNRIISINQYNHLRYLGEKKGNLHFRFYKPSASCDIFIPSKKRNSNEPIHIMKDKYCIEELLEEKIRLRKL